MVNKSIVISVDGTSTTDVIPDVCQGDVWNKCESTLGHSVSARQVSKDLESLALATSMVCVTADVVVTDVVGVAKAALEVEEVMTVSCAAAKGSNCSRRNNIVTAVHNISAASPPPRENDAS